MERAGGIRLELHDIRMAMSFPAAMDIVFYKDEKDQLYRLYRIDYAEPKKDDFTHSFDRLICLGRYAPQFIEGKIVRENERGLKIRTKNGNTYEVFKNAEKFEFWEVGGLKTGRCHRTRYDG